MKNIRKNYSLEFKIQAVSLSEQRGNVSLVAQKPASPAAGLLAAGPR